VSRSGSVLIATELGDGSRAEMAVASTEEALWLIGRMAEVSAKNRRPFPRTTISVPGDGGSGRASRETSPRRPPDER
jgi:hypothetical protein